MHNSTLQHYMILQKIRYTPYHFFCLFRIFGIVTLIWATSIVSNSNSG